MAITPVKPDFHDVTSRGKVWVIYRPTIATGGDTWTVPGARVVLSVDSAKTGVAGFTQATSTSGNGVVITVSVTTSSTGNLVPLTVYYV